MQQTTSDDLPLGRVDPGQPRVENVTTVFSRQFKSISAGVAGAAHLKAARRANRAGESSR